MSKHDFLIKFLNGDVLSIQADKFIKNKDSLIFSKFIGSSYNGNIYEDILNIEENKVLSIIDNTIISLSKKPKYSFIVNLNNGETITIETDKFKQLNGNLVFSKHTSSSYNGDIYEDFYIITKNNWKTILNNTNIDNNKSKKYKYSIHLESGEIIDLFADKVKHENGNLVFSTYNCSSYNGDIYDDFFFVSKDKLIKLEEQTNLTNLDKTLSQIKQFRESINIQTASKKTI